MISVNKAIDFCLKSILVLSLVDGILTTVWLALGLAKEANPIMDLAISHSYETFIILKMSLTIFGVYTLSLFTELKIVRLSVYFIYTVYFLVFSYHIYGMVCYLGMQ